MAAVETPGALRGGQLRGMNLFIMSMALVGPGAGAFFNLSTLGSVAGPAMVLSVVLSLVAALLLANTVAQFAGRVPGAGMFYTFVSRGLGPRLGFLAGWILMADYGATTAFGLVFPSDQVSSFLASTFALSVPWWLIFLVALGVVFWLSVRGIRPSLRTDMVFLVYELGALAALAVTVLLRLGPAHWSVVPFAIPKSGFGGVGLAWVLGITAFLGFEGSITAAEEASRPRQVLPRTLFLAVVVAGIFFLLTSYAGAVGYGIGRMGTIAANPLPWNTVANHFWGRNWGILVDVGAWVSMFAVAIASQNAAARLWFAMGRERVLPASLGRVATQRSVPLPALCLQAALTVVVGLGLGLLIGPFPSFLFLAIILSLGALIVWIMAAVSLIRFMRARPQEFRPWPHLILPVLSIAIVLPPMYSTVYPVPASPLNIAIYVVVAWILAGLALLWRLSRTAPGTLADAGRFLAVEDDADTEKKGA